MTISMVSSSWMFVNRDLISKLAIIRLSDEKLKLFSSLTKENVSLGYRSKDTDEKFSYLIRLATEVPGGNRRRRRNNKAQQKNTQNRHIKGLKCNAKVSLLHATSSENEQLILQGDDI